MKITKNFIKQKGERETKEFEDLRRDFKKNMIQR